jgi:hypothetical protein
VVGGTGVSVLLPQVLPLFAKRRGCAVGVIWSNESPPHRE